MLTIVNCNGYDILVSLVKSDFCALVLTLLTLRTYML
jgi:hypothetical protein